MSRLVDQMDPDRPPIFVGAGVIRTEEQIRYFAEEPSLAAQIIGSYSEDEHAGSDPTGTKVVFHYDDATGVAYNAIGLRNCGRKAASEFLPRSIKYVQEMGQLAIIGVTALGHEDPLIVVPRLLEWGFDMGADGVEINGSCPNEQYHILLCESPDLTCETISLGRERVGKDAYILVKMSPLSEQQIRAYQRLGLDAQAVDVINNCRRLSPINPKTGLPYIEVNEGYAGQSGPAIRRLARDNLRYWRKESSKDIWSIGGVDNGAEIYDRHHNLGAFLVGGAQDFYRSEKPRDVIKSYAEEYSSIASRKS